MHVKEKRALQTQKKEILVADEVSGGAKTKTLKFNFG
jgi:hypothetical protein